MPTKISNAQNDDSSYSASESIKIATPRSSPKSPENQKNRVCSVVEDSDGDSVILVNTLYESQETPEEGLQYKSEKISLCDVLEDGQQQEPANHNSDIDERKFVVNIFNGRRSGRCHSSTVRMKSNEIEMILNTKNRTLPLETLYISGLEPRLSRTLSYRVRVPNYHCLLAYLANIDGNTDCSLCRSAILKRS